MKPEKSHKFSSDQISDLVEIVPDNILIVDFAGKVLGCNNKMLELLGYRRPEMLKLSLVDLIHPEDLVLQPVKFKELSEGQTCVAERRFKRKDGTYFPVEVSAKAIDQGSVMGVVRNVAERQASQEALKESLDRLRLFDSLAEETILIHDRGVIVDVNKALARKLGYEAQEMIGKNLSLFSDKASAERSQRFMREGYPEGYYEIQALRKDGTSLPILVHGEDFELGGKKLRASIGWDITDLKRSEQSLKESEERFKKFAEVTKEGIFIHEKGTILDVNQALLDLIGWEASKVIGSDGYFLLTEESGKKMKELAQKGYLDQPYELTVRRKDGTTFPAEFHGRGFQYKGQALRVVSVWDVTERKRAEQVLRDSQDRFRRIFESSPLGIALVDLDSKISIGNPRLSRILGYAPGELDGRSFLDITHPDDMSLDLENYKKLAAGEIGQYNIEKRYLHKDGRVIWGDLTATLIRDLSGTPLYGLGMVEDITERKEAEKKVLQYERLAAVGQLSAGLAHEIRNPLAIISAAAQYLEKKMDGKERFVEYLTDILKQCKRLDTLVFDILDYSGRGSVGAVRAVDVPTLIRESLNLAQSQMGPSHHNTRVRLELDETLPQVPLNSQRMQRVFINIILNAYQATGEGGEMRLVCAKEGEFLVVRVEDNGPGITERDLPRLFEPFFTSKKTGSGLGLPICKRIVEEHNGVILVERLSPKGAAFVIKVPLFRSEALKILIIEDEASLARTLGDFLTDLGHQVQKAVTAAEGLSKASADPPDAVLLDLNLPDKLGLDILPQLKREKPGLIVVMMTASAEIKHAVEAMRAGAEDYLTKPLNLDELQILMERISEKLGLKREVAALKNALREGYAKEYLFLESPAMAKVYSQIEKVAAQDNVTVLILGETGTGKEHAARLIHNFSSRSEKPFVELHCGAFPETLLESELFGYEAGAFTDAKKQKKGLFEMAQGGTVFLDEVGEMPMTIQTKLLKVLEQKTLRRLGGNQEIVLDVRIISATNRDLEKEVREKGFRADLYYRLNVFPISIPPLRERPQDTDSLIDFFYREACHNFGKPLARLPKEVLSVLKAYSWPGNTRELKNVLCRMVLTAHGKEVFLEDVPTEVARIGTSSATFSGDLSMAEAEKQSVLKALERTDGNKSLAAKELGISRNTLLAKIKKYGL